MGPLRKSTATTSTISLPLYKFDPVLYNLIKQEKLRQSKTIALIASENYIPRYCSEALGSCLSSRYSEGYPGHRYYAGNETIDLIETLCHQRARKAFRVREEEWAVNVQALSGSPANFAVLTGILKPGDRILFMDLPHGGHLSHGFHTASKNLTATSKYFSCLPYKLNPNTELIDYDEIQMLADRFKPHVIIAGFSAYPRLLDYKRFKEIANSCGALLLSDIAHIAGLMAAGTIPSAFDHSDIVTTTTHKTLRGPRGALIFVRRGLQTPHGDEDLETAINTAVFPGCQGGPHNHTIGAIAAALKAASEPEFEQYQKQVLKNAKALAERLKEAHDFTLVTGGTENHLLLVDLTNKKIKGRRAEKAMELCSIICNKNTVLKDKSPQNPSGIRLGTPAMTSRGFGESEYAKVADLISGVVDVCRETKGKQSIDDWVAQLKYSDELKEIKSQAEALAMAAPEVESGIWESSDV